VVHRPEVENGWDRLSFCLPVNEDRLLFCVPVNVDEFIAIMTGDT